MQKIIRFDEIEHIWFLRNLIIFYLLVIVIQRIKKITFIANSFSYLANVWKNVSLNLLWLILLTIPVWALLMLMPGWYVTTDTYLIPRGLSILLYYTYFFGLGWLLHLRPDIFSIFAKRFSFLLAGAAVTTIIVWYAKQTFDYPATPFRIILAIKFIIALQMILLVSGISGLFLRLLNTESAFWRYLSDASYWVYLVHLAIIMLLQWQLINSSIPGIMRFPIVLGATTLFAFVTYHYFVRYTILGDILHGKRTKKITGKPVLEKA